MAGVILVAALVGALTACGPTEPAAADCEELAHRQAELIVDSVDAVVSAEDVDAFDTAQEPGHADPWGFVAGIAAALTDRQLASRAEALQVEIERSGCHGDDWPDEVVEARLSQEMAERSRAFAAHERAGDRADDGEAVRHYLAATVLAVVIGNLGEPPTYAVPEGFPPEFPVAHGAKLVDHQVHEDGTVRARWRISGESPGAVFEATRRFYEDALQQLRTGGWTLHGGPSSVSGGPEGRVGHGRTELRVSGYGHEGVVVVELAEGAEDVTVTAELTR